MTRPGNDPLPQKRTSYKQNIYHTVSKSLRPPLHLSEREGRSTSLLVVGVFFTGVSANADPHTNKLRTRVTHIWGNRRRQPNRSAMEGPLPGRTAFFVFHKFIKFPMYIKNRWGVNSPTRPTPLINNMDPNKDLEKNVTYRDKKSKKLERRLLKPI